MRKTANILYALIASWAMVFCLAAVPAQSNPVAVPVLGQALPAAGGQTPSDRHQMLQALASAGAQVRQYETGRGVEVRAYAAQGAVFGLAWQGMVPPDLKTLLGSHYAAYRAAAGARPHRGPVVIRSGNLVVELSGHMRDLHGRAYLRNAIPTSLSAAVIR